MKQKKRYFIYILASKKNGVLYVGITSNIIRRATQHRNGEIEGFTKKYFVKRLVHYESWGGVSGAIAREKQIKKWKREWKINLIEKDNPEWLDLFDTLF